MEIHRPKAPHTVREFALELVTIVTGILIAIGLEQTVEALHWQHKVGTARAALRDELHDSNGFYKFRVAINECVAQRLQQLNDIVDQAAAHKEVRPVGDLTIHMGHLLKDDAWQSERAAQTLIHLPVALREQFSEIYGQQNDIRSWVNQELNVWSGIRLLQGNPAGLAPSDLTVIRQNIQMARTLNYEIVINGKDQLSRATALGLPDARADEESVHDACAALKREPPSVPWTTF